MSDPHSMFDDYFIDTRTIGGLVKASPLYGNQQIKDAIFNVHNIGEAFHLALTDPYLTPAINEQLPHGVAPLAWEIARGCYIQLGVIGVGAAIGAIVGGVGGTVTLPFAGTVAGAGAGAALGASIAGWVLFGVGLPAMVTSAAAFSHDCSGILTPGKFGKAMHWKPNDDPREIAFMNGQIRDELQNPINYNVFQHGNANQNWVADPLNPGKMMLGWPSRDPLTFKYNFDEDEPLLFAIDGRTFVINWEQFGTFCKLFKTYSKRRPAMSRKSYCNRPCRPKGRNGSGS